MEWRLPSSLTTQANTRAAQILESWIYRNLNSSLVLSSIDSGADFQQVTRREKEWIELRKSWKHTRGWWIHIFIIDILKKEQVQSSRRCDETWVPGQGALTSCLDIGFCRILRSWQGRLGWVRMRDGSSESKSVKPARAKDIDCHRASPARPLEPL
jgi:hypothetical protein